VDAIVASIKERLGWRLGAVAGTSWEETTLKKMFNEYDTNSSGFLSVDELQLMIKKLEIKCNCENNCLLEVFDRFDRNNSGFIEYEEFKELINC
jgi:Ca2+-binding EF-hand superfamily protein